jgi:hypothetical protein
MLSPIANQLEVLERKQSDRRSDPLATPLSPKVTETPQVAARRNKYPHLELFDRDHTRYPSF